MKDWSYHRENKSRKIKVVNIEKVRNASSNQREHRASLNALQGRSVLAKTF